MQSNDGNYRRFNVQPISKEDSLFPRAHTCFNKLDLPLYDNFTELEAYLSLGETLCLCVSVCAYFSLCVAVVINMEVTGFTMD